LNVESWEILFSEALALPLENGEAARDIFERFLKRFPTSGRYWKFYAEYEASMNNIKAAQGVIQRGLAESVSMELRIYYIEFAILKQGENWDVIA
jgi:hypothetical protein